MENKASFLFPHHDGEGGTILNNIKFTHREMDIIAAILHQRGASKIASLLSISTRTVETHTANIMRKMDANSREAIIDFIERFGQTEHFERHYQRLLSEADFKKLLGEIAKLTFHKNYLCILVGETEYITAKDFICILKEHLHLCGFKTQSNESKNLGTITEALEANNYPAMARVLYIMPPRFIAEFHNDKNKQKQEIGILRDKHLGQLYSLAFVLYDRTGVDIPQDFAQLGYISFSPQENYHNFFLKVLKILLPDTDFDKKIYQYRRNQEIPHDNSLDDCLPASFTKTPLAGGARLSRIKYSLKIISLTVVLVLSLYSIFFHKAGSPNNKANVFTAVRSELVVPADNTFLNRPDIFSKLESYLTGRQDIQTVALIGIGGAGKTTIARKFVLQQKTNNVWEINADTRENLKNSFERLANDLCKTEEDNKFFAGLREINNKIERDEKILLFVREKLKTHSPWFLIYDNVNKFSDIQNYFPSDAKVWGSGKVIVTTSNSNTNNSLINNFIHIGELTPEEKLILFSKIMTNDSDTELTPAQQQQAVEFLKELPPFPLDVSIAAYYIKSTNTPYAKYLERVKENSKDFETIQSNVVKEASNYTKTRYSIVTLSLNHLIEAHKDFKELLLLISLLDSQNIPQALLAQYKPEVCVDNFIYNLRKYSLINSVNRVTSTEATPVVSVHRKTQEIILTYLVKTLDLDSNSPLLHSLITTLETYVFDAVDKEDFSRMKLLVPHCEAFLKHDHLLDENGRNFITGSLGCIYYYLRHNLKANQLLEHSLAELKQDPVNNHERIGQISIYLGNLYRSLGNYQRARDLLVQSLKVYEKYPNNARNAKALGYLGVVYRDLGDYKKAKELLEQSLAIHEKYFENQIGHAWVLTHLGNVHMIVGSYQQAKKLLEHSFEIYKKQSADYVGVSWVLGHLGTVHKLLGDCHKATELLEQSLSIIRKYFPDDHIYIASGLSFLAAVYIDRGDFKKAKNMLKDSLVIYQKDYGENHLETARVLRMLGEAYCGEGDIEVGEDYINKSLAVFQKKNHSEIYKSYESLGNLYLKKEAQAIADANKRQAKLFRSTAFSYLTQALDAIKDCFPKNSQHIERINAKLALSANPTS